MTIVDMLRRNALEFGDEVALVEINPQVQEPLHKTWRDYGLVETTETEAYRREITWSVFDEKANRFANLLRSRGVGRGDKVAILLYNCIEWLPIYFGILKTGAMAVPLNFRYTSEEINYCLDRAEADVLIFGPEFIGRVEYLMPKAAHGRLIFYVGDECPTFAESYYEFVANCSSTDPQVPLTEDDDAVIYFSSGTTGRPKAILHHHISLRQSAEMEQKHHGQTHGDVFLCIPPLYHTGAKMHWLGSLISGGKAVLLRGVTPKSIFEAISNERCTIVWLLVPWASDILVAIERGELKPDDYVLDQWRLMHIGAQPVPKSLIRRWKKIFPHHDYDTNYGLSESMGPGCVHLGVENIDHVGAIGVPGYRWQVKIVDDDGNEVVAGEVGELCVKGPGVMVCYYNDPVATAETIDANRWLHTGDMARQDEDGFYWLVDRKKDIVIMGGENIYPVEIEDYMSAHPAIQDVAVIGLPDERLGEIPAAIVQLKEGMTLTADEVNEFNYGLARYKRPRVIIFAHVPRNPTGKIQKPLLRQTYGTEHLVARENEA